MFLRKRWKGSSSRYHCLNYGLLEFFLFGVFLRLVPAGRVVWMSGVLVLVEADRRHDADNKLTL